jgi:hypothetical protein
LAYLIHSRARHSAKPTGYEKNIEHMRCQAPQSSQRFQRHHAGAFLLRLQAEYAVFQFLDSA